MDNRSTVVGVFDDRRQAERAIDELHRLGYRDDQIGFAARGGQAEGTTAVGEGGDNTGEGAATGAVSGGVIGGIIGAAVSGLIPGIGPILAGGILASVLGGAAVGAAAGGLFGALVGEGVPENEARYYDEQFRGGRTIVTVRADGRYDEAQDTLRRYGAYDVHTRPASAANVGANTPVGDVYDTTDTTNRADTYAPGTAAGDIGARNQTDDWNTAGPRYRQEWERRYGDTGRNWTDVEPYYHYGYEMSRDPRYQGRNWNDVESDLRTGYPDWANRSGYKPTTSLWEGIRNDLSRAWENLRGEGADTTDVRDRDRMPLREERLDVDKRDVQRGEARVRKDVVEERKSVDVPVIHEEAYVEEHPVSGKRPASGEIGSGEIRVPLRGEVVDVDKETVVRGDVEVGKRRVQDTEHVSDTVRREEATVDTSGDVEVEGQPGRTTGQHRHIYDEHGRCLTCGKERDERAA